MVHTCLPLLRIANTGQGDESAHVLCGSLENSVVSARETNRKETSGKAHNSEECQEKLRCTTPAQSSDQVHLVRRERRQAASTFLNRSSGISSPSTLPAPVSRVASWMEVPANKPPAISQSHPHHHHPGHLCARTTSVVLPCSGSFFQVLLLRKQSSQRSPMKKKSRVKEAPSAMKG